MSFRSLSIVLLAVAVVSGPVGPVATAYAAPSSAQVAADQAKVDRAVARLAAARAKANRLNAQAQKTSKRLDDLVAQQDEAQSRLSSRARHMYRAGDTGFVSVLLGAATFQEFSARWDLLTRMNEQDAADIEALLEARRKTASTARTLIKEQEEAARAADEITAEVRAVRRELASSKAALASYVARTSSGTSKRTAASAPAKKRPADRRQQLTGRGAWKKGVASHYSRTFTGRGASGKRIGPYSMMVAHKTLPFGTLIEFEYNGKRCVASVEDRGPHSAGRMFDLGPGVVRALDFSGVHMVRYRIISR